MTLGEDAESNWEEKVDIKFDFILMRHVLEHLLNPKMVLEKVYNTISDEGLLYLAVPDSLNPSRPIQGKWFRAIHTYYFNKFSLSNICSITRFETTILKEGDLFNKNELFLVGEKSSILKKPVFSNITYELQLNKFKELIRNERYLFSLVKSYINLYFPVVKSKKSNEQD